MSCFTLKLIIDDLYLLTNGTSKTWVLSVSLIDGYRIEDPAMIGNQGRQVKFSVNGDYQIDTSNGSGQFSSPIPFKLWQDKMVLNNDTLDIRHLSADTLVLEITSPVSASFPEPKEQGAYQKSQMIFIRKK